jgi:ATP-dependent helicase/DNAse subunit B
MNVITVICGSVLSDRSARIQALWAKKHREALLLTPTRRLAQLRQEALVRQEELPGLWGERAFELSNYAAVLLERSGRPVQMVSQLERNRIVWLTLQEIVKTEEIPEISAGFVRHLLQVITSMKQGAVEAPHLEEAIRRSDEEHPFDFIVSRVYSAYQSALQERGLYDIPGLFWEVEQRCRDGLIHLPSDEQYLFLDGFDDFTASQQRFLLALAGLASGMTIGLNYDASSPDLKDLYALQHQWLEKFQRKISVQLLTRPSKEAKTCSEYGALHIFGRNPSVRAPETLQANMTLRACADARHEVESIGRSIRTLLVEGKARPSEIAVALTDMQQQAFTVEEIFTAFSIPFMMRTAQPLARSFPAIFLSRLVNTIQVRDFQELAPLLSSSALDRPDDDPRAIQALQLLVRESGIVGPVRERQAAFHYLEWLIQQKESGASRTRLSPGCTGAAWKLLKKRLTWLSRFAAALPSKGTFLLYSEAFSAFLDLPGLTQENTPGLDNKEAIAALRRLLAEMAMPYHGKTEVSFADYFAIFQMALENASQPGGGSGGAGVFCCSPDDLRLNRFPYVFLGGLNEGALPRAASVNALYADRDLKRFRQQNLALPGTAEHLQRQRLLFHHSLASAEKSLALSWRKQDSDDREVLPSPFVIELKALFPDSAAFQEKDPGPDCFIADFLSVASADDLIKTALYRGISFTTPELRALFKPLDAVLAMEKQRYSGRHFSAYDGLIRQEDLLSILRENFGDKHQFSVSQLETWLKFPFDFFRKYVLRIRETRIADGEITPLLRGIIVHDALRDFFSHYRQEEKNLLAFTSIEERTAQLRASLGQAFERQRTALQNLAPVLVEMEALRLETILQRFLQQEVESWSGFIPWELEYSFGHTPGASEDGLPHNPPFPFELGDETILFSGTVDRVDRKGDGLRLIDYKSSSVPSKKEIMAGLSLQLSIYAEAVAQYFPDISCADAWYIPILKGVGREALMVKKAADFNLRKIQATQAIALAVQGIRNGFFPPLPHSALNTDRYPIPSAARYESWRIALKTGGEADRAIIEEEEE